jgi:hypothetical protein
MLNSDVKAMTCVRFRGGPTPPRSVGEDRNPGAEIGAYLGRELQAHDVKVESIKDIQYAHEVSCTIDARTYAVTVSFDWSSGEWWEVFYGPSLSAFDRLRGRSEVQTMRKLSAAIYAVLKALPGIGEMRWYADYASSFDGEYAATPESEIGVR